VRVVFDIGMYDGEDTAYYLESGYRVVSVEANPDLVESVTKKFAPQIAAGQFVCIHAAITPDGKPIELALAGADLGSSSVFAEQITNKRPIGTIRVPGLALHELIRDYGVPYYLKVDIEGADRFAILALTPDKRPRFLSFEVGNDAEELINHVEGLGFSRFKIINQNTFRELENQECVPDRMRRKLAWFLGYAEPRKIRRSGRFFVAGHSSGPLPWKTDGRWRSGAETRARLRKAKQEQMLRGWYDIHARIDPE
jgi:FkbM family methyltransferase